MHNIIPVLFAFQVCDGKKAYVWVAVKIFNVCVKERYYSRIF